MATKTISEKDKDTILAILDTYHDFCKAERASSAARKAKRAKEAEESEAKLQDEIEDKADENRLVFTRDYLPKLLNNKYTNFGEGESYHDNVSSIPGSQVNSVSHLEYQTVDYFEDKFEDDVEPYLYTKETLNLEDIVNSYKNQKDSKGKQSFDEDTNPLWKKYKEAVDIRILELVKGKVKLGKNTKNANTISNFILNFFFLTAKGKEYNVSFDAGQRLLGELFEDIDQMSNLIMPQNIADSAITFFGKLGGPNHYVFPSSREVMEFESNEFSKDIYNSSFINKGFSDKNTYGFSLKVEEKDNPVNKIEVPFSASPPQTEGPSVNYIIDMLQKSKNNDEDFKSIKRKGNMLAIGDYIQDSNIDFKKNFINSAKNQTNGFLFDIKRAGDHEQVAAVKAFNEINKDHPAILSTIDILCALKARVEKLNCVLQLKDRIILYRNPLGLPEDAAKKISMLHIKESITLLSKLNSFPSEFKEELKKQKDIFGKAKKAILNLPAKTNNDRLCLEATQALLRIKMLDSEEYLHKLINDETFILPNKTGLDELNTFFKKYEDKTKEQILDALEGDNSMLPTEIKDKYNAVKKLYQTTFLNIQAKLNFQVKGDAIWKISGTKDFQLTSQLLKDNTFSGESAPTYWFYFEPFKQFYNVLTFSYGLQESQAVKKSRDFYVKMKGILSEKGKRLDGMDYMATINTILDQFTINSAYQTALKSKLDFYSKAKDKYLEEQQSKDIAVKDKRSLPDIMIDMFLGKNGVAVEINNYTDTAELKAKIQAGGGIHTLSSKATVPKVDEQQIDECRFLLSKITSAAAAYIESAYTEKYMDRAFVKNVDELLSKYDGVKDKYKIDDISKLVLPEEKKEELKVLAQSIYFLLKQFIHSESYELILSEIEEKQRQVEEKEILEYFKTIKQSLGPSDKKLFTEVIESLFTAPKRKSLHEKYKTAQKLLPSIKAIPGSRYLTRRRNARKSKMQRKTIRVVPTYIPQSKAGGGTSIMKRVQNPITIDIDPTSYFENKNNVSLREYLNKLFLAIPKDFNHETFDILKFTQYVSIFSFYMQLNTLSPSLNNFLNKFNNSSNRIHEDEDTIAKKHYATILMDEIQMVWETGLHEIKYSTDYDYVAQPLETIVSNLLAMRESSKASGKVIVYESLTPNEIKSSVLSNIKTEAPIEVYVLYLLTLLENTMNKDKTSFFIKKIDLPKDYKTQWQTSLPEYVREYTTNLKQIIGTIKEGGGRKTRKAITLKGSQKGYTKKH